MTKHISLTQYLIEERRRFPQASGELNALLLDVALACKAIARAVAFGELGEAIDREATEAQRRALEEIGIETRQIGRAHV